MNSSIKNIFSFIKEVMLLKNKNIYDVNNYEINLDISNFYETYKEIISDKYIDDWLPKSIFYGKIELYDKVGYLCLEKITLKMSN